MSLRDKIAKFKSRSYSVSVVTGVFLTLILGISLFLLFSSLEYSFWFESSIRAVLFYLLLVLVVSMLARNVVMPLLAYFNVIKQKTDESAANEISSKIEGIDDNLINYLQLEENAKSELAKASISQKSSTLRNLDFNQAIDKTRRSKYAKYLVAVSVLFCLVAFINPPMITSGAERLVKHNQFFEKPAPFSFVILNDTLETFRNQDFQLDIELDGSNLPSELSILSNGNIHPISSENGTFSFTFKKPSKTIEFQLSAAGFNSRPYNLNVLNKPELKLMNVTLEYPDYIDLPDEVVSNSGNLSFPAGTSVTWSFTAGTTQSATFQFADDTIQANRLDENTFTLSKNIKQAGRYSIELENEYAKNESALNYRLDVTPDESPSIKITYLPDTAFYKYVVVIGEIEDDHGFHSLNLYSSVNKELTSKKLPFNPGLKKQGFYSEWIADTISLDSELSLYAIVRDNDQIAGYKSVKSSVFTFKKPAMSELAESISKKSKRAENQLDKALEETEKLRESLKELADRLKSENEVDWKEEKLIQDALEQREELEKMLEELQKKHEDLLKANQNFEQSEQLKKKSEQLDDLMKDLMDDETRQMYEELQKLLSEKNKSQEIQDKVQQISRQENRLQKDMERTKELFNRMKMETGLERASQQLDSLASKQMKLSEQAIDSSSMAEQEQIQNDFEEVAEDLEEIEKLNQELDKPEALEDFDSDEQDIQEEMKNAQEEMKSGDKKKSKQSQQKAGQKMQQMSKKMQKMQAGMEMEVMQENIEQLRKILDDLIKLSYTQEGILDNFKTVNASDPRFLDLSRDQVKLKEDMKVIDDSLRSLATRVVQLSSFITKEVDDVNSHMDDAVKQIRDRQRGRALSHQQFSMTSMNNLALMLNDVLQNMQMSMSEAMGKGSKGQKQDMPLPSLGEMQQQLGEQMRGLKDGDKSGRQLSEELARMAAEQEMIRQQLEQLRDQLNGQEGGKKPGNDLQKTIELMEENEVDLVNKRLTQQLIERQKEITTRMLEAEDALKEQEKEPDREAESAKQRERLFPPNFEEYLQQRKKEIELLRTIPIELKPFYKKEVNEYFRRLSEKQ